MHLPNGRERGKKRERETKGDEGGITLSYYLPPINNRDLSLMYYAHMYVFGPVIPI